MWDVGAGAEDVSACPGGRGVAARASAGKKEGPGPVRGGETAKGAAWAQPIQTQEAE